MLENQKNKTNYLNSIKYFSVANTVWQNIEAYLMLISFIRCHLLLLLVDYLKQEFSFKAWQRDKHSLS